MFSAALFQIFLLFCPHSFFTKLWVFGGGREGGDKEESSFGICDVLIHGLLVMIEGLY